LDIYCRGEAIDDLQVFDPKAFVDALLALDSKEC
jgi:signal recognition particle GTPase